MGKFIKESILDYVKNNFSRNIPYPSLITLLCIKGGRGVKFNEEEEKSPKTSRLTFIGALKARVEGEKVERIRKRKRTEEQPRETVPTVEAEEESYSEENEGFEGPSKKPFSPPPLKK